MEASEVLGRLRRDLEARGAPAFDWVVEFASDGDVDRAIGYFWVRCKDPDELELLARGLARIMLVEGQIALGRYLARCYPRAREAYEGVADVARDYAQRREYTWKEARTHAHEDEISQTIERALAALEKAAAPENSAWYKFSLYCRTLMRRALIATRKKNFWEVDYATEFLTAWRGLTAGPNGVVVNRQPNDIARVLRHAWPAPTLAQLMSPP